MLGSHILYFKGMRIMMFQLSGFYYKPSTFYGFGKEVTGQPNAPEPSTLPLGSLNLASGTVRRSASTLVSDQCYK